VEAPLAPGWTESTSLGPPTTPPSPSRARVTAVPRLKVGRAWSSPRKQRTPEIRGFHEYRYRDSNPMPLLESGLSPTSALGVGPAASDTRLRSTITQASRANSTASMSPRRLNVAATHDSSGLYERFSSMAPTPPGSGRRSTAVVKSGDALEVAGSGTG
jgi:hypothetical protein